MNVKNLYTVFFSVFMTLILSSVAHAEEVIRVGFIIDETDSLSAEEKRRISTRLQGTLETANQITYQPLGVRIEQSFELFEPTEIQTQGLSSREIITQARSHTEHIMDILDDTKTDVVFYVVEALGFACGSAEIPTQIEHFEYRTFVAAMKSTCINADVFGHELGHLFGARHDEANDVGQYIIREDARGCIIDNTRNTQGSLMSYASQRSAFFSTPDFCGGNQNNRQLIIDKAPLVATMFERHHGLTNRQNTTSNSSDTQAAAQNQTLEASNSGGGSLNALSSLILLLLLVIRCAKAPARNAPINIPEGA